LQNRGITIARIREKMIIGMPFLERHGLMLHWKTFLSLLEMG
jgi:hypothetical protein